MHGSYRRNFGPESVEELRNNITLTHEEFLKEDDPDKKADALRYMSAYAMQFLYLVPHDKKFIFKETERVLHHSSMNISDFDPREGSVAFEYLARYAHNILDQPWRPDFRVIKLTSGFYVHNISSQLHNAHEILVAMGYVHTDETTLKLVPNVDIKRLIAVSKDMIIASQECLVLSQIWQRVADQEPDYPLTIGEVFEFRRKYLGDTDTICKTLLSDIRRRQHEANLQNAIQKNQKFVPVDKLIDYEGMETDVTDSGKPEKEVDIIEHVLRNTRMLHQPEDEHIYDPVYNGTVSNGRGVSDYSQHHHPHSYQSQYSTSENSAFAPNRKPPSQYYHHIPDVNYSTRGRDSISPMIPKTVSNFHSNQRHSYSQNISNSSSMSSVSGKALSRSSYSTNQPLKFSKVPPEEENWNQERRESKKLNWSEFSGDMGNRDIVTNDSRRPMYERPEPSVENSRSRKPIMPGPGDVYPVEYFPRVVKPTPIHSSTQNHQYRAPPCRYVDDNSEEDVMHEALAYASEIKGMAPKSQNEFNMRSEQNLQSGQLTNKGGWETDSRSFSSENSRISSERDAEKRSASSTEEPSSWGGTIQRQTGNYDHDYSGTLKESDCISPHERNVNPRPSNIVVPVAPAFSVYDQQRFSESSPESINEAVDNRQHTDYREQYKGVAYNTLSSSSSPSPKSPLISPTSFPVTGEQLQSLDTVYYDYLLKKGHKLGDESMDHSVQYNGRPSNSRNEASTDVIRGVKPTRGTKSMGPEATSSLSQRSASERRSSEKTHTVNGEKTSAHCNGIKTSRIDASDPEANYNVTNDGGKPLTDKGVEKDSRRIPIESEVPVIQTIVQPWSCRFCTYRNTKADRICEICFKSKDFFEEPLEDDVNIVGYVGPKLYSQPSPPTTEDRTPKPQSAMKPALKKSIEMEIQCPQCTLLNCHNKNVCEACNFRLRPVDSPQPV